MRRTTRTLGAAAAVCSLAVAAITVTPPAVASASRRRPEPARHVLLLSVDGMHQSDLEWYVERHPGSALATLVARGAEFTRARTQVPSDSFPGLVGQITGGHPATTGVYYDDSYNHALLPPGTTGAACATASPGTEVNYSEALDKDQHALDAGQGLAGLPGSIFGLSPNADTLIDPANLPVDPASCQPVYPHQYLRVNTIFEVARNAGLRTAWSDKHAAYEIANGPSGTGVQDFFTPEINSDAPTLGSANDWTTVNTLTQQYDAYKVQAVVNEIHGYDHGGHTKVGTPAIFGMNFQTVSTAQKLPLSVTATSGATKLAGGYEADGVTPGPVLAGALDFVDAQVGDMLAAIHQSGLDGSTDVVLSAKHGQSPQDPARLIRIDDGPIVDAMNAAWAAKHPQATKPLVAFAIDDDGMLLWLNDRSTAASAFAGQFLLGFSGVGNDIHGVPEPFTHAGLVKVFTGTAAAASFGAQVGDPRVPDVFGIARVGVVYTGGKKKIAEHGGANPQDRDVPLVVAGVGVEHGRRTQEVETPQIAPTILSLLGLNPGFLQAVQIEHTARLPLG